MPNTYYDIHVHIAGRGDGHTGCWFSPQRFNSIAFRIIRWSLGLRRDEPDLDSALRARILSYISTPPAVEAPEYGEDRLGVVVLAHDWPRDARGEVLTELADFYVPNEYVLALAKAGHHLMAGVSIHPYRSDALAELDRCHSAGAVLVKWLPTSQNFSPADQRCRPFYQEMARRNLPLLCHTGSEGATRNLDKRVNDPRVLIPALEAGVKVIAAHSGLRSSPHDADYFDIWHAMLKDYPHLYGDTASLFGLRARRFCRVWQRSGVAERLLHGSDWPVPSSPWWFVGILPWRRIRQLAKIANPLWRDLATKRALGLPREIFTRAAELLLRRHKS